MTHSAERDREIYFKVFSQICEESLGQSETRLTKKNKIRIF